MTKQEQLTAGLKHYNETKEALAKGWEALVEYNKKNPK